MKNAVIATFFLLFIAIVSGCDDSSDGARCQVPTSADIHAAILAANPDGVRPGLGFADVVLPGFTCEGGEAPAYSISGLPSWLSFSAETRRLSLNGVSTVPRDAAEGITISYSATAGGEASSISLMINDADGDGMCDYFEYRYSSAPDGVVAAAGSLRFNETDDPAADFDGDGITNLAEAEAGTNPFIRGSGAAFSAASTLAGATKQSGVATGDVDGDGDLDIVVANQENNALQIFLGTGNGTFAEAQGSPVNYGYSARYAALADFDGDGDLDIAATSSGGGYSTTVLMGAGDGTFAVGYRTGGGKSARGVAAGDFNGDGRMDFAIAGRDDDVAIVFIGDGAGSFAVSDGNFVPINPNAQDVTVSDFDRDGDLDLAVGYQGGTDVSVLLSNGGEALAAKVDYPAGSSTIGITSGDFDEDGNVDLAVGNGEAGISILLGNGDGSFDSPAAISTPIGSALTAADFDGDGDLDIAGTSGLLLGAGDGTFSAGPAYTNALSAINAAFGDFDGDGDLDLATANYESDRISILINQ